MSEEHLVQLDEDDCWRLLATQPVGRIGLCRPDAPLILPVNYALVGHTIVFRTRVHAAPLPADGEHVAFEVDGLDARFHDGWSVLVTGIASHVVLPIDADVAVETWIGDDRPVLVAIDPTTISGRLLLRIEIGWAQDLRGYL